MLTLSASKHDYFLALWLRSYKQWFNILELRIPFNINSTNYWGKKRTRELHRLQVQVKSLLTARTFSQTTLYTVRTLISHSPCEVNDRSFLPVNTKPFHYAIMPDFDLWKKKKIHNLNVLQDENIRNFYKDPVILSFSFFSFFFFYTSMRTDSWSSNTYLLLGRFVPGNSGIFLVSNWSPVTLYDMFNLTTICHTRTMACQSSPTLNMYSALHYSSRIKCSTFTDKKVLWQKCIDLILYTIHIVKHVVVGFIYCSTVSD